VHLVTAGHEGHQTGDLVVADVLLRPVVQAA
jgi:hypothetical protein